MLRHKNALAWMDSSETVHPSSDPYLGRGLMSHLVSNIKHKQKRGMWNNVLELLVSKKDTYYFCYSPCGTISQNPTHLILHLTLTLHVQLSQLVGHHMHIAINLVTHSQAFRKEWGAG